MRAADALSPTRATVFSSVNLLCLLTVGYYLQDRFGLGGTVLMEVFLFLGLAALFARLWDQRPLGEVFYLRPIMLRSLLKSLLVGVLGWGLAQSLSMFVLTLVDILGGTMPTQYAELTTAPYPLALLVGAVVPAICEEAAFRGYVLSNLRPLGRGTAVVLTGILFGLMHLSLIRALPLIALGLLFSAVVERTGSIIPGMVAHFLNNATALTLNFFFQGAADEVASTAGAPLLGLLVSAALALLLASAAWVVVQSLDPRDAAAPALPPAEAPLPKKSANLRWVLTLTPLLPTALFYFWAAANELNTVFGPTP